MLLGAFGRRVAAKFIKTNVVLLAAFLMVGVAAAPTVEAKTKTHKTQKAKAKAKKAKAVPYQIGTGAIVINEATGEVLYSRNADKKLYPASMTKVMTLYLTFQALENGTLTLNTKLPVSREAASRAPSKLGLAPGSTISVEDAILALVTRSANDVAAVLAEGIGGTESDFGYLMTAKARELGMKGTLYRNASGLPNKEQVSTPRDQAILGVAIHRDFPKYYAYFATRSFTYNGVTHTTHNRFALNYRGADGIKTGFIGMSGFNLLAAAQRDGTRLVGVVFGGSTAKSRDAYMAEIMDASFSRAKGKDVPGVQYVKNDDEPKTVVVAKAEPTVVRVKVTGFPEEAAPKAKAVTLATLNDQVAAQNGSVIAMPATLSPPAGAPAPGAAYAAATPATVTHAASSGASSVPVMQAAVTSAPVAPLDEDSASRSVASAALETADSEDAAAIASGWAIQVGAFSKRDAARAFAQKAAAKLSDGLDHVTASVSAAGGKKTLYRSRLIGFNDRGEAQDACAELKRGKVSCIIVAPGTATASLQ